jgi:hypothetical protein
MKRMFEATKSPKEGARRKPEPRGASTARTKRFKERLKAEGRVRLELTPLAEHVELIKAFAARLDG